MGNKRGEAMNGVLDSAIYNPLEDYEKKLKSKHYEGTQSFFDGLVQESGVAAKNGYTTRIPFVASKEIKEQAKGVFF